MSEKTGQETSEFQIVYVEDSIKDVVIKRFPQLENLITSEFDPQKVLIYVKEEFPNSPWVNESGILYIDPTDLAKTFSSLYLLIMQHQQGIHIKDALRTFIEYLSA